MTNNQSQLKDENIRKHYKNAYELLNQTSFAAPEVADQTASGNGLSSRRRYSSDYSTSSSAFSVIENTKSIDEKNPLMSDEQHHVINVLQQGIALAAEVADTYDVTSGLKGLRSDNAKGILHGERLTHFASLKKTHAYITVFTLANYVQAKLDSGNVDISTASLTKPDVSDSLTATKCFLYNVNKVLLDIVKDDSTVIAAVKQVALDFIDNMRTLEAGLEHTNGFIGNVFRSEMLDFDVNGFELSGGAKKQQLVMTFKTPEEVIGNRIAKFQMKKLAKMLMCYDPTTRKNPFVELGGFIFTFMGDGAPGTGKTTLIQMLCGLLNDYCQIAGRDFYYENFSVDQIDSFQGKSGQNAKQFINNVLNPNAIGFGTIDDIDQIAGKRGDKQSSGGQQEVTAVLMEAFAGANTVVRGNATFGMFSNYPENVDDALRQRAGARYLVDGPQTAEDYTDLLALLLQSRSNIDVGNAELYETQKIEGMIQQSYAKHNEPETPKLMEIYQKATAEMGKIETFDQFGRYLKMIKDAEPRFTGRAIKNIADAAKMRAMDIEMPDEWFEDPDTFYAQPYETKLAMIKELSEEVTPEMLMQELHRYADSEFRYADKSDDAEVEKMVRNYEVQKRAEKEIQAKGLV